MDSFIICQRPYSFESPSAPERNKWPLPLKSLLLMEVRIPYAEYWLHTIQLQPMMLLGFKHDITYRKFHPCYPLSCWWSLERSEGRFKNIDDLLNLRALKISTSFNVWMRYFVWNFKGTLWNSTQNILSIHWKMCILFESDNFRALRFKSS